MADELNNRLTVEQVEQLLASALPTEQEHIQFHAIQLGRQLAETMRENQYLRSALEKCYVHLSANTTRAAGWNFVLNEAEKALSNKQSEHGN